MVQPAYKLPRKQGEPNWPAQGEWTYEDYLRLPEDGNRYEVIRGVLYVTAPPTYKHQTIVGELMLTLGSFVRERVWSSLFPDFRLKVAELFRCLSTDRVNY